MRVAFISQEFPPAFMGGAGTYAYELVAALASRGIALTVFTVSGAEVPFARLVEVAPLNTGAIAFWRRLPSLVAQTAAQDGPFDVIHGNSIADLTLPRWCFGGSRVVTTHHVTSCLIPPGMSGLIHRMRDLRGETGLVPLVEGHVMRRAHRVIAVSEATQRDITTHNGIPAQRIDVVHNGIRLPDPVKDECVSELRARFCRPGETLLLSVGRLEQRKGTDILLHALARLKPDEMPYRLLLAGAGPIEQYAALARALGIEERVHILGKVDMAERDTLYAACDLFVLASRFEGFGLAAIEAMAAGKPIVMTATGAAVSGLLNNNHGVIVPTNSVDGLVDGIRHMFQVSGQWNTLGQANRAFVAQQLSWATAAERTHRVYLEAQACSQRSSTPANSRVRKA